MSYMHPLSVFFTVVEEGSFSAAAKKLSLTQPTISFHIDNLEKKLGCQLFTRNAKGVSLTIYGKILQDKTRTFNTILNETKNQIAAIVSGVAGEIIIGASTIPGEYILPNLIHDFLKQQPGIRISIKNGNSSSIMNDFICGKLPIGIVGIMPSSDISGIPLWSDELVLAAHPGYRSQLPAEISITDLVKYPFIARDESSGTSKSLAKHLAERGVSLDSLNIVLKVGGNEALKSAIVNKTGIGFVSKRAIQAELSSQQLTIIDIFEFEIKRKFYAIHTTPLVPTCLELFWQFLTSNGEPHI